jgi:heme/copper-type cytochrome/quinol oxidase subunit 2
LAPRTTNTRPAASSAATPGAKGLAALALVGLVLAVLAAPADASVLGPRAGHSPNADDIRTAYWVAIVVAVLLIVVVNAFLIAALIRFRARRGVTPKRLAAGPGAFLRPAVPLGAIAIGLFVFGIVITSDARNVQPTTGEGLNASKELVAQAGGLTAPPDAKPLEINVVGQRWLWRFDYPQTLDQPPYSTFSYNELVVPVDTTVILHVTSTDVDHRWFIPALGGQVQAVPGHDTETWFRADRKGVYPGQSTAYSGTSYAVMRAWVRVVSPEQYQRFVSQKRREIAAAQDSVQKAVQQGAAAGTPAP